MKRIATALVLLSCIASFAASCGDGADDPVSPTPSRTATRAAATVTTAIPTKAGPPFVLKTPTETTASGLRYHDEKVGEGASPTIDKEVTVHYTGRFAANSETFDSSVDRGTPARFRMSGVIKGFSEALSTMKVGGKRTVFIPSALGYGPAGSPPRIPGNSDLIFEIELITIH